MSGLGLSYDLEKAVAPTLETRPGQLHNRRVSSSAATPESTPPRYVVSLPAEPEDKDRRRRRYGHRRLSYALHRSLFRFEVDASSLAAPKR